MKEKFLLLLFTIGLLRLNAQAPLTTGALEKTISIYNYAHPGNSNLGTNIEIKYNSGNGMIVDRMPGALGEGWNLQGIPTIVRIQIGEVDDLLEYTSGSYYNPKMPPGYIYNNKPIADGCPALLNYFPIFQENAVAGYYENNKTTADRELDLFMLELGDRRIPFVLNKSDLNNCITLDNSKVIIKVNFNAPGNIDVTPLNSIRGFVVIDENGIEYDFNEAEVTKAFDYNLSFPANSISDLVFQKSAEAQIANAYIVNSWYASEIRPAGVQGNDAKIKFEYITQIYDFKKLEVSVGELSLSPFQANNQFPAPQYINKGSYTTTLPPPYSQSPNTIYFRNLMGKEFRTYIKKKEIKKIILPNKVNIEFEYTMVRKDLPGANALSKINVNNEIDLEYSFVVEQSYFIKNDIRQPINTEEEKWTRLCFKSFKKINATNTLTENPYVFDYYKGSNSTEDFVAPPFFHVKDPFGYYNGSNSGTPTDRLLGWDDNDVPNWAKVCFYNNATFLSDDEIIYNPKINYAKNGLLRSITYPTGGKEVYEYEQNYTLPEIADYNGKLYKSFTKKAGSPTEYAVGGVSLSKISFQATPGVTDVEYVYDYSLPNGISSRWGYEAGRVKSHFTTYYEPELKVLDPISGNCHYEYVHPGVLKRTPISASPKQISSLLSKVFNYAMATWGLYSNLNSIELKGDYSGLIQMIIVYIVKYILNVITTCFAATPSQTEDLYQTNFAILNSSLPVQYKNVRITEISGTGQSNGSTLYEFTSPNDFPLLVASLGSQLYKDPRCYEWMYGLPKKISVYDKNNNQLKVTENTYTPNNEILSGANTASCNCQPTYKRSVRFTDWYSSSYVDNFTTTNSSSLNVDFYNVAKGNARLTQIKETTYKNGIGFATTTEFYYNSNEEVSKTVSKDSKDNIIESRNYYVDDYNLSNPSNSILNILKGKNNISTPICTEKWILKPNEQPAMLSASILEYGQTMDGEYKVTKTYELQSDKPEQQNVIGVFNPDMLIRNPNLLKPVTQLEYNFWSMPGPKNIIDISGNRLKSVIYQYPSGLPIASITNASSDECEYIPGSNFTSSSVFFTQWSVLKESKVTFKASPGNAIKVALGLWNGASWVFTDINPFITETVGSNALYYEYNIPAGYQLQVRNDNSCQMEEFRFHPKNATMTTVSYDLNARKKSESDINSRTIYYEYDGLGRISKVFDERHNIIKTYEYHFKN